MANNVRPNHHLNNAEANNQSTVRSDLSTNCGAPTSWNKKSCYQTVSTLLAEPRNADSIGDEVNMSETDVEDSQFLRRDRPELWKTEGQPPERKLKFRYSKYAICHPRYNHPPQGRTKANEEKMRDLKIQRKCLRK